MKWWGELSRVQMNVPYGNALDSSPYPPEFPRCRRKKIRKAATSALTFMTFS
jgi:hypothetical protein